MKELEFYLWGHILLYIHKNKDKEFDSMDVCKELNISSTSSVSVNTRLLEKYGLIKIQRDGRYNLYVLTKEGVIVADHLQAIFNTLKVSRKK
jgi:predicted MarR family transcription regulator